MGHYVLSLLLKVKKMSKRSLNNRRIKGDIIRLRSEGKTYNQIAKELSCSKSVISYHCGSGSEKARVKKQVANRHPLCRKVSGFKTRCSRSNYKELQYKLKTFKRKSSRSGNHTNTIVNSVSKNYTCKDVLKKIGDNPICYLTGKSIDLNKPETYNLDHIIPTSKGGTNDLNNLGLCLWEANVAKGSLSLEDFYDLCESILAWRDKCKK